MLFISLATLRTQAGSFVAAAVALFCASALVTACGMLLDTGIRGHVRPERYAGAPLLVAADQQLHFVGHKGKTKSKPATDFVRLPNTATARVRAAAGVGSSVGEFTFPATILGSPTGGSAHPVSWGHGWGSAALTPFSLRTGRPPAKPDEVVVDAATDARIGQRLVIQTPDAAAGYAVVGIAAQALPDQRTIFFADSTASRLAGDRLSAIGVWPAPGADRRAVGRALETLDPAVKVYTGDARGTVESAGAARARITLISMSAAIGGTALLVAILVVVGTFALSIGQRHRALALLRAVGATPRQLRRMLGREALIVSLLAAGAGSLAGLPLARWLRRILLDNHVIPARLDLVIDPFPALAAVLATTVAGVVAARIAARRTLRVSTVTALTELNSERNLGPGLVAGLILVAAGTGGTVLLRSLHTEPAAVPVSMLVVVVAAAGLMLLGSQLGRIAAAAARLPLCLVSPVAGYLAGENLRADPRRMSAVTAPITLAVAMAATILFTTSTIAGAADRQVRAGTVAPFAIVSSGAGVPADVGALISQLPGVTAVTQVAHSTVWIGKNRYPAQGVSPAGLSATMRLGVVAGSAERLEDGSVAVSTTTAKGLGKQVGDTVSLRLGDGTPERLRIAAIYTRGLGFGAFTLPYSMVLAHLEIPLASTILIAAPRAEESRLRAITAGQAGETLISPPSAGQNSWIGQDAAQRQIALGLIVGFAAISVVNTLAMATVGRRRELALLRRVGATRRQVLRMLRVESIAAAGTGLILGSVLGGAVLLGISVGMTGEAVPAVSGPGCLAILAGVAVLAYLATAIPARIMLRADRFEQ